MKTTSRSSAVALCAALISALLAACGGGGGDGGGATTPPTLTFNYKTTSLVGSPSFVISSVAIGNTSAGTVTLAGGGISDVIGYTLNTANGLITPTGSYTALGDLSKAWLMVCKPLQSVDGNVNLLDTGPKSIYVAMPDTAVLGTTADVSGKTFDFHENCAVRSAPAGVSFTAASLATPTNIALFSDSGFVERSGTLPNITTDVSRLKVYTAGSKVFMVSRTVKTPASENTWGSLGIWVSR